ncbi:unnamed protein product [Candida verbasci]|uniref:Arsenical-resistance protein ACR3 n=1 Tax=Candida verbasci TaxID=1227364 RepID=A0A9W4TTF4_9ASCO|nr:unnamed protein product [Candida verbasci]
MGKANFESSDISDINTEIAGKANLESSDTSDINTEANLQTTTSRFDKFKPFKAKKKDKNPDHVSLSLIDKLLPLFIVLAIILGILLSVYVPSSRDAFSGSEIIGVSIPLAIGLIIMMIPPLVKVEWEKLNQLNYKVLLVSLLINWIICPLLMFGLAWLVLFNYPEYRIGIIMIGLARCIAMVLIWNEIALGDNNLCAIIVVINSILQVILYAPLLIFYCYVITGDPAEDVSYELVAKSVAFFLGVPLGAGIVLRTVLKYTKTYDTLIKFISPWSLIGLLYTIIVIFIEKGNEFIHEIGDAFLCFVPLALYFLITWFGTFFILRWSAPAPAECCDDEKRKRGCNAKYAEVVTQTFTASSNNFELSLAVAISIYGSGSKQAIASTFGVLLEVPILLVLSYLARYFKNKLSWGPE